MGYHSAMPNTGFRLERDLVTTLRRRSAAVLESGSGRGTYRILSERQVGMCIPDLLIVRSKPDEVYTPLCLSYSDCALVAATLEAGKVTVAHLAASTYSLPEEVGRRVVRLVKLGLMSECNDRFRVRVTALPTAAHVTAVEVKLSRWRTALRQARGYLRFSNEAYVALPASVIARSSSALTACADSGVGAIAVDERDARVVLRAKRHNPRSAEWVRIVSDSVGLRQTSAASSASHQAR